MLEITSSAAEAIRGVLAAVTPPADSSMRISSAAHDGIEWELVVGKRPAPGDQVIREQGVEIVIDPDAVVQLADRILDARLEGGRVRFSVERQDEFDSPGVTQSDEAGIAGAPDQHDSAVR